jgi:hypothetical protein
MTGTSLSGSSTTAGEFRPMLFPSSSVVTLATLLHAASEHRSSIILLRVEKPTKGTPSAPKMVLAANQSPVYRVVTVGLVQSRVVHLATTSAPADTDVYENARLPDESSAIVKSQSSDGSTPAATTAVYELHSWSPQ